MNIDKENIKALAEILSQYGLTSLEIRDGETEIKLQKTAVESCNEKDLLQIKPEASQPAGEQSVINDSNGQPVDFNKIIEVRSPLVGVFYSSPSPDNAPYVTIGSKVKKGDILCIVETMKLMNEITAESDGEIVDICVKNGDITEYGQVLFKMF